MHRLPRTTRPRAVAAIVAVAWLAFLAHTLGLFGRAAADAFDIGLYGALMATAALACFARALSVPRERLAWSLMGLGLAAWTAGDAYWSLVLANRDVPVPSIADALYLAFYPLGYTTLVILVRQRADLTRRDLWLDGAIGAACIAAVAIALAGPAFGVDAGGRMEIATNLAYPVLDVVLLVFAATVLGLAGWRPGRRWLLIAAGLATMGVADGAYLVQVAQDSYVEGGVVDAIWPASALLVALGAWQPTAPAEPPLESDRRQVLVPVLCGVLALAMMSIGVFGGQVAYPAIALALVTLLLVAARMTLAFSEAQRTLLESRRQAMTDGLTGLGNRRRLLADLRRATTGASGSAPWLFVVFDLDGFKAYNDSFGHPAGDRLLARLAQRLTAALGEDGTAYRLGGDEFCLLARCDEEDVERLLHDARAALTVSGEGFSVGTSAGAVWIPADAQRPAQALQIADRRMYEDKGRRYASAEPRAVAPRLTVRRQRSRDYVTRE